MKSVSAEYTNQEEADQRQSAEIYHIWFEDEYINLEWFYTSSDQPITYGEHVIEKTDLSLQISSYDETYWQIYSIAPVLITLVDALYEKYIGEVEPDWETNPEHISGREYWIYQVIQESVTFENLESVFRDEVNTDWDTNYPGEPNPWTDPYDSTTGIVATEGLTYTKSIPFVIALVKALYIKYIEPYDADWAEKPGHVYGQKYWVNQVELGYIDYADLEEHFRASVNTNWDETFPDIDNPWTDAYDPTTGIVVTENYQGVTLDLEGFITETNNTEYPIENVLYEGSGVLVLKSALTLTPELSDSASNKTTSDCIYLPATLQRGTVNYNSELDVQSLKITASYLNDVSLRYIAVNPVSLLWISVMKVHLTQVPLEADVIFLGQIKDVSFKGSAASIGCVGFSHFLKMTIPVWRYQLTCNHRLFDDYCTLDKESTKVQGIITLDGVIITSSVLGDYDSGYFTGGEAVFGSESRKIVSHAGNSATVAYRFTELKTDDYVVFYPGCDGRIETCRDTFDNILNYLGFPFIPLEQDNPAIRTTSSVIIEQPDSTPTAPLLDNDGWNDPGSDNYWGGGP